MTGRRFIVGLSLAAAVLAVTAASPPPAAAAIEKVDSARISVGPVALEAPHAIAILVNYAPSVLAIDSVRIARVLGRSNGAFVRHAVTAAPIAERELAALSARLAISQDSVIGRHIRFVNSAYVRTPELPGGRGFL